MHNIPYSALKEIQINGFTVNHQKTYMHILLDSYSTIKQGT